jgi:hypothetical protein
MKVNKIPFEFTNLEMSTAHSRVDLRRLTQTLLFFFAGDPAADTRITAGQRRFQSRNIPALSGGFCHLPHASVPIFQ